MKVEVFDANTTNPGGPGECDNYMVEPRLYKSHYLIHDKQNFVKFGQWDYQTQPCAPVEYFLSSSSSEKIAIPNFDTVAKNVSGNMFFYTTDTTTVITHKAYILGLNAQGAIVNATGLITIEVDPKSVCIQSSIKAIPEGLDQAGKIEMAFDLQTVPADLQTLIEAAGFKTFAEVYQSL